MSVVILAQFLATWALSGALIGVVFGAKIGILAGLIIAVGYWALVLRARAAARSVKRIRFATLSAPPRRPIRDP